jgi:dihydrofolate reductase
MRKIIYAMSVSLDGFIEAANGDLSWTDPDEELHQHFNDREQIIDMYLYGRRMYENMVSYWPTADMRPSASSQEVEYAQIWREKPKVVFSKTLDQVGWNARVVKDNIAAEVGKLKAQPGGDMSVSGAGIAATFMRLGLIDEYCLYVRPVILGGGKPMFPPLPKRIDLRLAERYAFNSGVILLKYQRV